LRHKDKDNFWNCQTKHEELRSDLWRATTGNLNEREKEARRRWYGTGQEIRKGKMGRSAFLNPAILLLTLLTLPYNKNGEE